MLHPAGALTLLELSSAGGEDCVKASSSFLLPAFSRFTARGVRSCRHSPETCSSCTPSMGDAGSADPMSGATLRTACEHGLLFQVERIIAGANDKSGMRSPIYQGMQTTDWVTRKALVDMIRDTNSAKNAAIHVCCIHNRPECLAALLSTKVCDVKLLGQHNLSAAAICCSLGHDRCLALLIAAGVDLTCDSSLLLDASMHGHAAIVSLCLEHGAPPNAQNGAGNTALHLALLNSHSGCAAALLQFGALTNVVNASGQLPVDCCSSAACQALFSKHPT